MAKKELLKQANFAKLVNQSPIRIHYLIETRRLPFTEIDGVKFIEATEANINIAKRLTKQLKLLGVLISILDGFKTRLLKRIIIGSINQ
jgi:hypothetical protein